MEYRRLGKIRLQDIASSIQDNIENSCHVEIDIEEMINTGR